METKSYMGKELKPLKGDDMSSHIFPNTTHAKRWLYDLTCTVTKEVYLQ